MFPGSPARRVWKGRPYFSSQSAKKVLISAWKPPMNNSTRVGWCRVKIQGRVFAFSPRSRRGSLLGRNSEPPGFAFYAPLR